MNIKELGISFWTENIYPKLKNLSSCDQQEAAKELLISDTTEIDDILNVYDTVPCKIGYSLAGKPSVL